MGNGKFVTKDSGERQTFATGMQRDSAANKLRPDLIYTPMSIRWSRYDARLQAMTNFVSWFNGDADEDHAAICLAWIGASERSRGNIHVRWAELMGRGAEKYGERNWELAATEEELARFRQSAFRHFLQWFYELNTEEDHAAAVFFNISGAEYVKGRLAAQGPKLRLPKGQTIQCPPDSVPPPSASYEASPIITPWRPRVDDRVLIVGDSCRAGEIGIVTSVDPDEDPCEYGYDFRVQLKAGPHTWFRRDELEPAPADTTKLDAAAELIKPSWSSGAV